MSGKEYSTDDALNFLTEGGGASKPILERKREDGEKIDVNPNVIVEELKNAMIKLGIDPDNRNIDAIIANAASGIKRAGY